MNILLCGKIQVRPEKFSNWCRGSLSEPWNRSRVMRWWEGFWTRVGKRVGGLLGKTTNWSPRQLSKKVFQKLLVPTSPWTSPISSCLGCCGGLGDKRCLEVGKFSFLLLYVMKHQHRFILNLQTWWPFHLSSRCLFWSLENTSDV